MSKIKSFDCFLLDLDGTLLGLSDEVFYGEYPKLVYENFNDRLSPEEFSDAFWAATKLMMSHSDVNSVVVSSFLNSFSASTKLSISEIQDRFKKFYESGFLSLKKYVEPIEGARELVKLLIDLGKTVILATNPVFVESVTRIRCKWAGIDYDTFAFVSNSENSNFTKPHPSYYLNLLNIAGSNTENSIMIGNDYLYDMSASKVGIQTWLAPLYIANEEDFKIEVDYTGSLTDLIEELI